MTSCEPGRFCPDHPVDPGLLVLIAATIVAFALAAVAAAALAATFATAAQLVRRRLTRRKNPTAAAPGHTLQMQPAAAGHPTAEEQAIAVPGPGTALDVIAAALDDWWITTDPSAEFNGAVIAPHVAMYLLTSGYRITPTT